MADVVCQCADVCVLLLISVISTDISWEMLSFLCHRLSAGTLAYWLWLNYSFEPQDCCLAICGPCQWLSGGWRAECWEWYDDERVKMIHALCPLTFPHQQKRYACSLQAQWILAVIQHCFSPTILHDKTFSTCSEICWWIDPYCCSNIVVCHDDACLGGIDRPKPLQLRQFMPTAWQ